MHLLIDGYNLLHATPELGPAQANGRGREALTMALRLYRKKKQHFIKVIFDGGPDPEGRRESVHGIPIEFSGNKRSADQVIAEMARRRGPSLTVITNDQELSRRCRRHGADVIGSRIFAQRLMETAQGWDCSSDEEDEIGWDYSTKKKGPSRRKPKARRRQDQMIAKL